MFGQQQRSFEAFGLFRILAGERVPVEGSPIILFSARREDLAWL